MVSIKGIQKVSMIDFPGKLAPTVFLSKCNFRCHFCHNPELVLDTDTNTIPEQEFLEFLEEKIKWIDGVCITGGEPTLNKDLPDFARKIKNLGLAVKIDTNGTNPEMLKQMIEEQIVDYVAMDIKASPEMYEKTTGIKIDLKKIKKSIELLMNSGIEYEFRTTAVPQLFKAEDALKISELIKGAKKYYLQHFNTENKILNPEFQNSPSYTKEQLQEICNQIKSNFEVCEVRGI